MQEHKALPLGRDDFRKILREILNNVQEYLVESNREAGEGRPDILIKSYDVRKPAVIIEIKHAKMFKNIDMESLFITKIVA
ncbi:PD-(D/E)XK nuclease domain-containing protein [Novisyntrophococcus fermenticellae]|uniref:PD-(D/E)XK nuclease domain-containing protein n=1 Tax=Novisyntrophococcus fermenticellae TaxID=2068655 RepID=UPI001E294C1E|nr:PD-(D/E)XK nuclease domain-containing protein [Novisyntrophococcus fermenticellae]